MPQFRGEGLLKGYEEADESDRVVQALLAWLFGIQRCAQQKDHGVDPGAGKRAAGLILYNQFHLAPAQQEFLQILAIRGIQPGIRGDETQAPLDVQRSQALQDEMNVKVVTAIQAPLGLSLTCLMSERSGPGTKRGTLDPGFVGCQFPRLGSASGFTSRGVPAQAPHPFVAHIWWVAYNQIEGLAAPSRSHCGMQSAPTGPMYAISHQAIATAHPLAHIRPHRHGRCTCWPNGSPGRQLQPQARTGYRHRPGLRIDAMGTGHSAAYCYVKWGAPIITLQIGAHQKILNYLQHAYQKGP
jgi:hypothetical protein